MRLLHPNTAASPQRCAGIVLVVWRLVTVAAAADYGGAVCETGGVASYSAAEQVPEVNDVDVGHRMA